MNHKITPKDRYNLPIKVNDCYNEIQDIKKLLTKDDMHKCKLGLNSTEMLEFGHYVGMMKDLGNGNMAKGIEIIRENHKWLKKQRDVGNKISICILTTFIVTIISGILGTVWLGIKHLISK